MESTALFLKVFLKIWGPESTLTQTSMGPDKGCLVSREAIGDSLFSLGKATFPNFSQHRFREDPFQPLVIPVHPC